MEAKKSPLQYYLNALVLCSSLLVDKMSLFMMKNPDLSSVFLQNNRNPGLLLNSNSSLVIVFTDFSVLKGFSLLQPQVYFKVVVGLSISKGCSTDLRDGENISFVSGLTKVLILSTKKGTWIISVPCARDIGFEFSVFWLLLLMTSRGKSQRRDPVAF